MILILLGGFYVYVQDYYHADASVASLQDKINYEYNEKLSSYVFQPQVNAKGGIVFYPGAKVDELAYVPLMEQLSKHGYRCYLVKMPFHLAVLGSNKANLILDEQTDINNWYMMGHSLGGAMAAQYTSQHLDKINGLILLGAYSSQDISKSSLKVLSIYGSEDQVLNIEKYQKNLTNLPSTYNELMIYGGNHAQFGNYGEQLGDGKATISSSQQLNQTVQFIIENIN